MNQPAPAPASQVLDFALLEPFLELVDLPDGQQRLQALKALRQLPMPLEAWLIVFSFVSERLHAGAGNRPELPQTYLPRPDLIESLAFIPLRAAREELNRLLKSTADEEQRHAAYALAQRRDPLAADFLLADLRQPDRSLQLQASRSISLLDTRPIAQSLLEFLSQPVPAEISFWLTLALARDDSAQLPRFQAWLEKASDIHTHTGSLERHPASLRQDILERGPYPAHLRQRAREILAQNTWSPLVHWITESIMNEPEPLPAAPAGLDELELLAQADAAALQIERKLPDISAFLLYHQHASLLRQLNPRSASALEVRLCAKLADPANQMPWVGDLIVRLLDLPTPFKPNFAPLFDLFKSLPPYSPLSYQVAYRIAHLGYVLLLKSLAEPLRDPDPEVRRAALRLLEQAAAFFASNEMPLHRSLPPDTRPTSHTGVGISQTPGFAAPPPARQPVLPLPPASTDAAEPPALGLLGEDEPSVVETFSAFPDLQAPRSLQPEQTFTVSIGFRQQADPNLESGEQIVIENPPADAFLRVHLSADGADLLGASSQKLKLDLAARIEFTCQVRPEAAEVVLHAKYVYQGQTVSLAVLPIGVFSGAEQPASQAATPAPQGEADALLAALAVPAENPCRIKLAQDPAPPDLEITVRRIDSSTYEWIFGGDFLKSLPETLTAQPSLERGDARAFAGDLIQQLRQLGFKGAAASDLLLNFAQGIREAMPPLFFNLLALAHQSLGRTPTVLILTDELYVPWELAWIDPPLDPAAPPYLGAQAVIGRWFLNPNVAFPPPGALKIAHLSAVASEYGLGTDMRELPEALNEQKWLADTHGAEKFEAKLPEITRLTASGHANHLVHFAVHGQSDPDANESNLLLADKNRLPPGVLVGAYRCGQVPRFSFIFLNACQVATAGSNLGQAAGFPGVLIKGGVMGFLAPLWEVHDEPARKFAEGFYSAAFEHSLPVGEYLRQQRKSYLPAETTTPLAYIYYGHPALKLSKSATA